MKVSGQTERCGKFPVFKDKDVTLEEPTWKQVESQYLELGLHRLHRMVKGEHLFAREEKFPPVLSQVTQPEIHESLAWQKLCH